MQSTAAPQPVSTPPIAAQARVDAQEVTTVANQAPAPTVQAALPVARPSVVSAPSTGAQQTTGPPQSTSQTPATAVARPSIVHENNSALPAARGTPQAPSAGVVTPSIFESVAAPRPGRVIGSATSPQNSFQGGRPSADISATAPSVSTSHPLTPSNSRDDLAAAARAAEAAQVSTPQAAASATGHRRTGSGVNVQPRVEALAGSSGHHRAGSIGTAAAASPLSQEAARPKIGTPAVSAAKDRHVTIDMTRHRTHFYAGTGGSMKLRKISASFPSAGSSGPRPLGSSTLSITFTARRQYDFYWFE